MFAEQGGGAVRAEEEVNEGERAGVESRRGSQVVQGLWSQ